LDTFILEKGRKTRGRLLVRLISNRWAQEQVVVICCSQGVIHPMWLEKKE
jgi:hypothetical protein